MKINSELCHMFVPHHKNIHVSQPQIQVYIFLWLGTNVGQNLEPVFLRFIARASKSSGLQGYQLTFLFLPRDLKKLHLISQTYCVSEVGLLTYF